MSTVAEIEAAISRLPLQQAAEVSEWLEQWLEDQRELSPEFVASMERGRGRHRGRACARGPSVSHARRGLAGFFTRI